MYSTRNIKGSSVVSIPKSIKGSTKIIDLQEAYESVAEPTSIDILTNEKNPSLKIKMYNNSINCFEILDSNNNTVLNINGTTINFGLSYLIPNVTNTLILGSALKLIKEIHTQTINAETANFTSMNLTGLSVNSTGVVFLKGSRISTDGDIVPITYSNLGSPTYGKFTHIYGINLGSSSLSDYITNAYITNIYGNIKTPSQPLITTVGTLTGLSVNSSQQININSTRNSGSDILISTMGGTNEQIVVQSNQSTLMESIKLNSNCGGVAINAGSNITGTSSQSYGIILKSSLTSTWRDIHLWSVYGGIRLLAENGSINLDAKNVNFNSSSTTNSGMGIGCNGNNPSTSLEIWNLHGTLPHSIHMRSFNGGIDMTVATGVFVNGSIVHNSDINLKDILGIPLGIDFINKINAISYKWKPYTETVYNDDGTIKQIFSTIGKRIHYGVSAQSIQQAFIELNLNPHNYGMWCLKDKLDENSKQMIVYDELIAPLIVSCQELDKKIKNLETEKISNEKINYFCSIEVDDTINSNVTGIILEKISTGLYKIIHNLNKFNIVNITAYKKVNTNIAYNLIEKTENYFIVQTINFSNGTPTDSKFDCIINIY
jgi:hypothetical protein